MYNVKFFDNSTNRRVIPYIAAPLYLCLCIALHYLVSCLEFSYSAMYCHELPPIALCFV